jgi:hypothetical protein
LGGQGQDSPLVKKDSTEWIYITSNVHNGLCCYVATDSILMHWSFKYKTWSLVSDDYLQKLIKVRNIEIGELKLD